MDRRSRDLAQAVDEEVDVLLERRGAPVRARAVVARQHVARRDHDAPTGSLRAWRPMAGTLDPFTLRLVPKD